MEAADPSSLPPKGAAGRPDPPLGRKGASGGVWGGGGMSPKPLPRVKRSVRGSAGDLPRFTPLRAGTFPGRAGFWRAEEASFFIFGFLFSRIFPCTFR
jgi:hypothetical protein